MSKLTTAVALIAMAGAVGVYSPAFAQAQQPAAGAAIAAGANAAGDAAAGGVKAAGDATVGAGKVMDKAAQACHRGTPMPANGACADTSAKAGASGEAMGKADTSNGSAKAGAAASTDANATAGTTDKSKATDNTKGADATKAGGAKDAKSSSRSSNTLNVTTEQKTTIRQSIKEVNVAPVTNINFDISIGVAVPHEVHLNPLPATIIKIVPEYSGYLFFVLADGRIVIVDPDSLEIVLII